MSGVIESRNPQDTPLSELDCEVFTEFYYGFLGKSESDKIDFLKALTLMRQGKRRVFVHSIIAARKLAEYMLQYPAERALLLAFPSTLDYLWSQMLEYRRNYAGEGTAPLAPIRTMAVEYLGQVEHYYSTLVGMLKQVRPIQPKEKFQLSIAFANTGHLKKQAQTEYNMLMVILADHPFLCVMPTDSPSTMALGKLRTYVTQILGASVDSLPIEFFTVGGGYLKKKSHIEFGGHSEIFDISFDNPTAPYSSRLQQQFLEAKFNLTYEILSDEFPTEAFAWETGT